MKIDAKDVERFYLSKKALTACPTCGAGDWIVANNDDSMNYSLGSTRDDGSVVVPSPSVPLLTLVCGNCFTLRLHALSPFMKWLQDNPRPAE